MDATLSGSCLYCSAIMKQNTAGGSEANRYICPRCMAVMGSNRSSSPAQARPVSGQAIAPTRPMCQLLKLTSIIRTPSENSISGMQASPIIFSAVCRGAGNRSFSSANTMPSIIASIIGLAMNLKNELRRPPRPVSMIFIPTEK